MTQKFIGEINVSNDNGSVTITMPTASAIPPKQEWSKHAIWQFNGKAYRPLTQKAEDDLTAVVKKIESFGFKQATKPDKRKPTSIRYAVLTVGVEPFYFI